MKSFSEPSFAKESLPEQRQVIVVGSGPAGSATACFLARSGVDVLLLDKEAFPRDKTCGDALSPRGLRVLEELDLLPALRSRSHRADEVHLYAPNHRRAIARVPSSPELPGPVLVIPRLALDHLVQQRAIAAGAEFRVGRVEGLLEEHGRICGVRVGGEGIGAGLVVIATGATTGVLRTAGLLKERPEWMVAARAYYEEIPGLEPQLEFYFDHVTLPGYAWLFPCGPRSANVGVGFMGRRNGSPLGAFEKCVGAHPRLREVLSGARRAGEVKSYPLRADFPAAARGRAGVVVVGEAVGLVNPFTGEGIDYALESGQILGETFAQAFREGHPPTLEHLRLYEKRLEARFRRLFVVLGLARRLYYNRPMLNRLFGRGPRCQRLVDTIVEVCFGTMDPLRVFAPRTLVELLRP